MLFLWFSFPYFYVRGLSKISKYFSEGWRLAEAGSGSGPEAVVVEEERGGRGVPVWALCSQVFINLDLLPYSKYRCCSFWLLDSGKVSTPLFTGAHPREAVLGVR